MKPSNDVEADNANKINLFRTLLPQILACTGKNLLLIDLGLSMAFPTVIIPALRGLQPDRYPDEPLHFSVAQAAWFGSLAFVLQPIGSALSGWVTEHIGRKRAMLLVNVPYLIGWLVLYFAQRTEAVFVAVILFGVSAGFMEAPVVTYVGEICQPSIRGILIAFSGVAVVLGMFLMYLLGAIMTWRNSSLICLTLPIITFIAIGFLPESPLWLLSKDRVAEAESSLQWLRGWVSPEAVATEFNEMKRYSATSKCCVACQKAAIFPCLHPPIGFAQTARELCRKQTLRPFALIVFCFGVSQFSGMVSIRPYMVQLFGVFAVPIDANWTTVLMSVMSFVANIVVMLTVSMFGKRKLFFFSLAGAAISCLLLSTYAYQNLPMNQSSFELNRTAVADNLQMDVSNTGNYFTMVMFLSLAFCTSIGITTVPWMFMSELFPNKTRAMASGLTAALNHSMGFASVKLYVNMESSFTIFGTFLLFGIVNVFGLCVLYVILPETEGRTLEEIELYFADNSRSITDRHIRKMIVGKNHSETYADTQSTPSGGNCQQK